LQLYIYFQVAESVHAGRPMCICDVDCLKIFNR